MYACCLLRILRIRTRTKAVLISLFSFRQPKLAKDTLLHIIKAQSITMSHATDNTMTCRSSASRSRIRNRLASQDPPSLLSLEYNAAALARPKRTNASFLDDSSPAAKRARMLSYLQEALDLCDTTLALLDGVDTSEN
jgi:hypothetical protein